MLITNFASGELSQNLNGRVDIAQYYQGAARIENFEIIPTGGIKRRPGTRRLAQLSGNNRLIPFIVDKYSVYLFELAENPNYDPQTAGSKPSIINIWQKGVFGSYSIIQTIGIDYLSLSEIKEIHYAQNYDTIIFVHRNYRPVVLKFNAGQTFDYSRMEFDFIPDIELDDDFDYVMVVAGKNSSFPTKLYTSDGHGRFSYRRMVDGVIQSYTKNYSVGIKDFWCIRAGKLYKYDYLIQSWVSYGTDTDIDTTLFTDEVSKTKFPGCVAFFNNRLFFASTKSERQKIWGSAAPDGYGLRYNDFSPYKKYVTVNRVVKDADLHFFTGDINAADIDNVNHRTTIRNVSQDFTESEVLKNAVTDYYVSCSDNKIPVGTKVVSVTSNTIVINTNKINAGTNFVMSLQLWKDADNVSSDDYEYTVVANNVTTADCSLFFELASDQNDAIMFLSSNKFLAVGTESSIWSVDASISALSVNAVMQGRYGSDEIQGQAVETATVYFAQGKKGIREFYYDGESKAFKTNNIALLADHLLRESPATDFDYSTNPYSKLIIVRQDGVCVQMLYDKTNGIMAWSRIIMSKGKIQSCAVTRGDDENDFIFFVVKDGDNYFLELLNFNNENQMFLDSWNDYTGITTGYTAGAILYNKTTGHTCDYDNIPSDFINAGDIVYIGYKFRSYIKSMPVIAGDPSKRIRITALLVRFLDSFMPVIKCTDLPEEHFNTVQNVPYSGIAKANYPGITDHDQCFELESTDVRPVNILSVDAQTS